MKMSRRKKENSEASAGFIKDGVISEDIFNYILSSRSELNHCPTTFYFQSRNTEGP